MNATGASSPHTDVGRARLGVWLWIAAGGLLAVGILLAALSLALGETRQVEASLRLPAVFALVGVLLALMVTAIAASVSLRARRRRTHQAALATAAARARQEEHESHRRFLARLDHELKNPVTAIRAAAVSGVEGAAGVESWASVDAQARRLSTLVRDLRKLAELETRPLERERVDLEALLLEAVEALRQQDPAAGSRLAVSITRVPWPVPPVSADLDLLSVAVDNVLANAAKFSSGGAIEVRLREQDGWGVIEVADAGRGIPAADLPHVFDELARAQNARDVPGSGLGLALVAIVVRRHGGDVSVRSVEGAGTVLVLRLPAPGAGAR